MSEEVKTDDVVEAKESKTAKSVKKKEIDIEKIMHGRSSIKNLCPWAVSFWLSTNTGDVYLEAGKKTTLLNSEIINLAENRAILFAGTGNGDHARIYIENEDIRKYVGFETDTEPQKILTEEVMDQILGYKTISTFKKHLEDKVVASHEKHIMMNYARKVKLNDFEKIDALEEHTKLKFKEKS